MFREMIHKADPYAGFDPSLHPEDRRGWASSVPLFRMLFEHLKPRHVIEVGTWKGASAIHMAELAKEIGIPDFEICCVDTWLGSVEHWDDKDSQGQFDSLNLKNGFPTLYYTFLRNVVSSGHQDVIVPFPIASSAGARFFIRKGVQVDAVYLDAAHEYEEVATDIKLYWKVLRSGGILFGDDFSTFFDGVVRAVAEFAEAKDVTLLKSEHGKWVLQKP